MAMIEKRKGKDGKERYRAKVRVKGRPAQSKTFTRLTDAKRWAQKTETAIRDGKHFPKRESEKNTLADLIRRYTEEVLPHKEPKLAYEQKTQLKCWENQLGAFKLAELSPSILVEARNKLIQEKTPRGGLRTPSSANRYIAALSHAFTIALEEWEWCDSNPIHSVKKFKEPGGRTRFLSYEELEQLLAACKQSRYPYLHLIVTLAVSTGMRHGEIMDLERETVNLKDSYLILTETKTPHNDASRCAVKHCDSSRSTVRFDASIQAWFSRE